MKFIELYENWSPVNENLPTGFSRKADEIIVSKINEFIKNNPDLERGGISCLYPDYHDKNRDSSSVGIKRKTASHRYATELTVYVYKDGTIKTFVYDRDAGHIPHGSTGYLSGNRGVPEPTKLEKDMKVLADEIQAELEKIK